MTKENLIRSIIESGQRVPLSKKEYAAVVVKLLLMKPELSIRDLAAEIGKDERKLYTIYRQGLRDLPKTKDNVIQLLKRYSYRKLIEVCPDIDLDLLEECYATRNN